MPLTKAQKDSFRPDWERKCEVCEAQPVVPVSGLCGPCHFGEADTMFGDWWDDKTDDFKGE